MNEEERMRKNFLKRDIYQEAVDLWGEDIQLTIAIEEMSELTKAICKFKRFQYRIKNNLSNEITSNYNFDSIIEKIADVQIMLNQLKCIFGKLTYQEKKGDAIMNLLTRLDRTRRERGIKEV